MLKLTLFGAPKVHYLDESVEISGRALALFAYLVLTGQPQDRSTLANLLWTGVSEREARKNLRYVLYQLRQIIGDYIIVTPQTIAFDQSAIHWVDVTTFTDFIKSNCIETGADRENLAVQQEILKLYRGELLTGFYLRQAPIFEAWLHEQRYTVHHQAIQAFFAVGAQALNENQYEIGLDATQQLLRLEPGCEAAHRQRMQLLTYMGRRSAALAQYATCQQLLKEEFGAEPEAVTTELYRQIQKNRLAPLVPRPTLPTLHQQPETSRVNWDAIPQCTHFIGRQRETQTLVQWLRQDHLQLIGLFGLPGQGKSALAAEVVGQIIDLEPINREAESRIDHHQISAADSGSNLAPAATSATSSFATILWHSAANFSSLLELLQTWCQRLAHAQGPIPPTISGCFQLLLTQLRRQRTLLILDDVDVVFDAQRSSKVRPGWEPFEELLRRVAENRHSSRVLLVSQIVPAKWRALSQRTSTVRDLALHKLSTIEVGDLLNASGFKQNQKMFEALMAHANGHPCTLITQLETLRALKMTDVLEGAEAIELAASIPTTNLMTAPVNESLQHALHTLFHRLPHFEQTILFKLMLTEPPPTMSAFLRAMCDHNIYIGSELQGPVNPFTHVAAIDSLQRHQLLYMNAPDRTLRLPDIVLHFLHPHMVTAIGQELAYYLYSYTQCHLRMAYSDSVHHAAASPRRQDDIWQENNHQMALHLHHRHLPRNPMEQTNHLTQNRGVSNNLGVDIAEVHPILRVSVEGMDQLCQGSPQNGACTHTQQEGRQNLEMRRNSPKEQIAPYSFLCHYPLPTASVSQSSPATSILCTLLQHWDSQGVHDALQQLQQHFATDAILAGRYGLGNIKTLLTTLDG